jgi:hypothetical protein
MVVLPPEECVDIGFVPQHKVSINEADVNPMPGEIEKRPRVSWGVFAFTAI